MGMLSILGWLTENQLSRGTSLLSLKKQEIMLKNKLINMTISFIVTYISNWRLYNWKGSYKMKMFFPHLILIMN